MPKQESTNIKLTDLSDTAPYDLSLKDLTARLAARELEIQAARDCAIVEAAKAVQKAIQQGGDLKEIRNRRREHGDWLLWLETYCPTIPQRTAYNYIRVHDRFANLLANGEVDLQSLTQLYIACGILPESAGKEDGGKARTGESPFVHWAEKLSGLLRKTQPSEIPEPDRAALRPVLEPVARVLWPERFA